jgi:hypothetical protein
MALTACVQVVSRKNTDPSLCLLLESLAAALMFPVLSLSHSLPWYTHHYQTPVVEYDLLSPPKFPLILPPAPKLP